MNKIGVHALTFIGDIKNHSIEKCLSQVAKIGYDVMELPLLNPDALDTDFVSKTYEKFNIDEIVSELHDGDLLGIPADYSGVPMTFTKKLIKKKFLKRIILAGVFLK